MDNADLTVTGGTISNDGNIDLTGTSTYTIASGVTGTNEGTVNIGAGATVYSNARIEGDGENVVAGGGTVYFAGDTAASHIVGPVSDGGAIFQVNGGATFTYTNGGYAINDGTVIFNGPWAFVLDATDVPLVIGSNNGQLTVPAGKTLRLKNSGAGGVQTVSGAAVGAKILVTGTLQLEDAVASNFYDSTNNLISGVGTITIPASASTYDWSDNAAGAGSSVAGWLGQ
jgi:fibronectin-binding autotransporter adhesin